MTEKQSDSHIRILLAQFMIARDIDIEDLYRAIGVDPADCDQGALSHMAGVLDGMTAAATRIRRHGLDNWAKS